MGLESQLTVCGIVDESRAADASGVNFTTGHVLAEKLLANEGGVNLAICEILKDDALKPLILFWCFLNDLITDVFDYQVKLFFLWLFDLFLLDFGLYFCFLFFCSTFQLELFLGNRLI